MIFSQLKRLKEDLEQTQHYIRRLEKDQENDKIPFYETKLQRLYRAVERLEAMIPKT
ncbi:MAG: hypothetical protein VW683_17025 [Betaproteobacteria bacterium]